MIERYISQQMKAKRKSISFKVNLFRVFKGSTFGFFVPVSGSTVVKIHLVHGLTVLKITSPIFTQPQVSSSYADAPLITKLGRNCSGLTGFSNRVFRSVTDASFIKQ